MNAESEAEAVLRACGEAPDDAIDVGEAALALASFDRPRVGLGRYRDHLAALARDVAAEAETIDTEHVEDRAAALSAVLIDRYGYAGDRLTYDDLQNANLMRVIDRRKGLPVALGVLYIATAQRLGWDMVGLNFPGHFLIRLDHGGARAIIDPFHGGRIRRAPELRELLKSAAGAKAELSPAYYAPVRNRDILLRLQNNIKLRLLRMNQVERAFAVVERMMLLAPGAPELIREAGLFTAHLGDLEAAIALLERYLAVETNDHARHQTAALLQDLRTRLN